MIQGWMTIHSLISKIFASPSSGKPEGGAEAPPSSFRRQERRIIVKIMLAASAIVGTLVARFVYVWQRSYTAQRDLDRLRTIPIPEAPHTSLVVLNYMAQTNNALLGFVMSMQDKMMQEFVFEGRNESSKSNRDDVHEISCRQEYVDDVKRLIDNESEELLKQFAAWAHNSMEGYNLRLNEISLETESAAADDRNLDVVVCFSVYGKGEDALRFQGEASRKLRDIGIRSQGSEFFAFRAHVRWR